MDYSVDLPEMIRVADPVRIYPEPYISSSAF
jgi:hypothetical protein